MELDLESCSVRSFRDSDAAELAAQANNRSVWLQLRDRFPIPTRSTMHGALVAFTCFAFAAYGVERLFAVPLAANTASCRVLEKVGYRLEGRMRRSAVKDGVVQDQLLYAIVRGDGASVRA